MPAPTDLAQLDRGSYVSLTTYRRDGTPVATPVWFAVDGDRILVWTDAASGKVKRLRNNPAVTVAPCDGRGKPKGPARSGRARLLDDEDRRRVHDLLNRKYGLLKRAIEVGTTVSRVVRRQSAGTEAGIEITLDPAG